MNFWALLLRLGNICSCYEDELEGELMMSCSCNNRYTYGFGMVNPVWISPERPAPMPIERPPSGRNPFERNPVQVPLERTMMPIYLQNNLGVPIVYEVYDVRAPLMKKQYIASPGENLATQALPSNLDLKFIRYCFNGRRWERRIALSDAIGNGGRLVNTDSFTDIGSC